MTKIVFNNCYGGFSLSAAGIIRYAAIKGISLFEGGNKAFGGTEFYTTAEAAETKDYKFHFRDRDLDRADPALAQVVEELGGKANGPFAVLLIQEIPEGGKYRIQEYDGNEWVEQPDDIEWKIA